MPPTIARYCTLALVSATGLPLANAPPLIPTKGPQGGLQLFDAIPALTPSAERRTRILCSGISCPEGP